jgi:hypothetical protein
MDTPHNRPHRRAGVAVAQPLHIFSELVRANAARRHPTDVNCDPCPLSSRHAPARVAPHSATNGRRQEMRTAAGRASLIVLTGWVVAGCTSGHDEGYPAENRSPGPGPSAGAVGPTVSSSPRRTFEAASIPVAGPAGECQAICPSGTALCNATGTCLTAAQCRAAGAGNGGCPPNARPGTCL